MRMKQVNKSDMHTVEKTFAGFIIKVSVSSLDSNFAVHDADGDHLINKENMKDAIKYIQNRLEREAKKADKPREKLALAVIQTSNYGNYNKATKGTLTSIHGGTGQVIIDGSQSHDKFFPDTPHVAALIARLGELEVAEGKLTVRLNKHMIAGRRSGYGRGFNVDERTAELVKEYEEKSALKS